MRGESRRRVRASGDAIDDAPAESHVSEIWEQEEKSAIIAAAMSELRG